MSITFVRHTIPHLPTRGPKTTIVDVDHVTRYALPNCQAPEAKHYWLMHDILAVVLGEQTIYIHMKEKK